MTPITLISNPDDVTPDWLTDVLRASGAVGDGRVVGIASESVGTGQVGDSVRFSLTYDEPDAGPPTVVGKFPSADDTSRAAAAATRTYEVETRFYQQLRHRVDITTPVPHLALIDVPANRFVIIMNDLAPAEQGDQITGCDEDVCALAMEEAAKLHAPVWGDRSLEDLPWLNRGAADPTASGYAGLLGMMWPGFLERYDGRVEPDVVAAGGRLMERIGEYMAYRPEQLTAAHGDFRLDNMLFSTAAGGAAMTTVDWQTVALGPGVSDISYFLGTSPLPATRARSEQDLVKEYHRTLVAGGVRDYPFEQCWHEYRRFAFAGFIMAVLASMLVGQTDRGDEMFMAMANRSGRMAIELETLAML